MKKQTKATAKKQATTPQKRGGARANAGRPASLFEFDAFTMRLPIFLSEGIEKAGIQQRTAYINYLVATDLAKRLEKNPDHKFWAHFCESYLTTQPKFPIE